MVVELDQPELGAGAPARRADQALADARATVERPAPALGEHTEEVLREAGFADEEIAALLDSGAAAGPQRRQRPSSGAGSSA